MNTFPAEPQPERAPDERPLHQTGAAPESSSAAQHGSTPTETQHARPQTGPIFWGAVFLAVCVYVAQNALAPGEIDTVTWVISALIGIGVLLLAVGTAVLIRTARHS